MTSSLEDVVTLESPDVNVTISYYNVTVAATSTKTRAKHVFATVPFLVMVTILFALAVVNLCGNGFTLITIRYTPRLWTKTNIILTSMIVSDFITGVSMLWYNPYILWVNVFNNPCRFNVVITVCSSLIKTTSGISNKHNVLIAIERYIATNSLPTDHRIRFPPP